MSMMELGCARSDLLMFRTGPEKARYSITKRMMASGIRRHISSAYDLDAAIVDLLLLFLMC